MGNVTNLLPILTVNDHFMRDFMSAEAPCFSMGYIEEKGSVSGFFTLRPEKPIPASFTMNGFQFGHSVLALNDAPVLHFAFHFYDYVTYNALVNPGNPIVQAVLNLMLEKQDYFFLAINPDQTATTFRSLLEYEDLAGLQTNMKDYKNMTCIPAQYEKACEIFARDPYPPGEMLTWVCRDNLDYLDLSKHRLDLNPR